MSRNWSEVSLANTNSPSSHSPPPQEAQPPEGPPSLPPSAPAIFEQQLSVPSAPHLEPQSSSEQYEMPSISGESQQSHYEEHSISHLPSQYSQDRNHHEPPARPVLRRDIGFTLDIDDREGFYI